jgi:hypothetical protein
MTCQESRDAIQELVDGTLGPSRTAELQQHVAQCAACRALASDLQQIRSLAASLDHPAPPVGVWLQIAGRLRQEGRGQTPPVVQRGRQRQYALLALAAGLIAAIGASLLLFAPRFRGGQQNAPQSASGSPEAGSPAADDTVQSVESEFRLAEQHLQSGIAKLEEAARLDESAVDPRTVATLKKSLEVIDQAIAESRAALKSEPQSTIARTSLFDALRRKVVLLQDTIALMNEMRKGDAAAAAQIVEGVNKS